MSSGRIGQDATRHDDCLRRQSHRHARAFGALAFGIGTSEVEHVLATQTLLQYKPKTYELRVDGPLARGVTAKDLILYLIAGSPPTAARATCWNTPARRFATSAWKSG